MTDNRQQLQHTTDNSGQNDPYVSFLLRQATQKIDFIPGANQLIRQ